MAKINDYLWHLPHPPSFDDPPDISELQQRFNAPIVGALEIPLADLGYDLKSNDVTVRLDVPPIELPGDLAGSFNTFFANIRFIKYIQADVITRIHIEHDSWSIVFPHKDEHRYFINLDRFKITDQRTQVVVPSWSGRLHMRMSNRSGVLEHDGEDQIWVYTSGEQFEQQLQLLLDKLIRLGIPWLEDPATF